MGPTPRCESPGGAPNFFTRLDFVLGFLTQSFSPLVHLGSTCWLQAHLLLPTSPSSLSSACPLGQVSHFTRTVPLMSSFLILSIVVPHKDKPNISVLPPEGSALFRLSQTRPWSKSRRRLLASNWRSNHLSLDFSSQVAAAQPLLEHLKPLEVSRQTQSLLGEDGNKTSIPTSNFLSSSLALV